MDYIQGGVKSLFAGSWVCGIFQIFLEKYNGQKYWTYKIILYYFGDTGDKMNIIMTIILSIKILRNLYMLLNTF